MLDIHVSNTPSKIYQYSIISAFLDGQTLHGIPLKDLAKHGDFGLGSFQLADGEMIMLDGKAYHMCYDGSITPVEPSTILPYAMVTFYKPNVTATVAGLLKPDFQKHIEDITPTAKNYFLAIRFDGVLKKLKFRIAKGQDEPGANVMKTITKTQRVIEMEDVEGTMIGFRSPDCYQGITVAGYHLHFIKKDRSTGGHCLDFEIQEGSLGISIIRQIDTELPDTDDFCKANVTVDHEGIVNAE
ncbi:alpha-acetolactate decarboxylase [Umbelopsis sp. AD052]|nr:alpha-acetolactate decarboxylase [Umbelopsis sp. AD052]